jgi:putative membrane protein
MTREPTGPRALPTDNTAPETRDPRGPRAFDMGDGTEPAGKRGKVTIEETPEPAFSPVTPPAPQPEPPFFSLSSIFWAAVSLLFTLYIADGAYALVISLQQKSPVFGQIALGLIGIVALGVIVFLFREFLAILRVRKVAKLREAATSLLTTLDKDTVRAFVGTLRGFYARDATAAAGRAEIDRALGELHDPRTLLVIAERALLTPKDVAARKAIAQAAQRVSVVTALSPRAIVDVGFVLVQSVSLIRRLSTIYGGRASGFGLVRLTARVLSHLAVTGSVAVADSFVSQIVGAGLATRLSAKFGEGVLNGVLTARVGIAAADLCRPLPYIENLPISISEVVFTQSRQDKVAENPAA